MSWWAAAVLVCVVIVVSFSQCISVEFSPLATPWTPPIVVGEHERVWFLPENTTSYDSYDYKYDVMHDPPLETIELSPNLHAMVHVPFGMSYESDHPFVRSTPHCLRDLTFDTMTHWIDCALVAILLLQFLIACCQWRLVAYTQNEDLFMDAVEPPPDLDVDAGGDELVAAVMVQMRYVIALQMHLRGLLADEAGDVLFDAVEPEAAQDMNDAAQVVADNVFWGMAEAVAQFAVSALVLLIIGFKHEWFGSFVWDRGRALAAGEGFDRGSFVSRDGCLLLAGCWVWG